MANNRSIIRVDLSQRSIHVEEQSDIFFRKYLGGKGVAAYYLLNEVPKNADPLGPENVLVFCTGVLAGTSLPGFSRAVIAAKSPLTAGHAESEVGGSWAAELKRAGYDALIVSGKSDTPVCIEICDERLELVDASSVWGLSTQKTENGLRDHFPRKPAVMSIGPAGENLVKFACIMQGERNAAGRGGLGAVMGSKNLKAVAVCGTHKVKLHDESQLSSITKWFAQNYKQNAPSVALFESGTAAIIPALQASAMLPTRNFARGQFEHWKDLSRLGGTWDYEMVGKSCWACPIRCKRSFKLDEIETLEDSVAGPEYETIGSFGSNLCIGDLMTIVRANHFCNEMGLDTISAGVVLGFVMECVENGLIQDEELLKLRPEFGNEQCVLPLLELITYRRGFGDTLAEGVRAAAEQIGGDAHRFAMHVKGQELPMHDPRGKVSVGIGYAVAEHGADHMTAMHDTGLVKEAMYPLVTCAPLGLYEPTPALLLDEAKVRQYYYLQTWWDALKCLGACFFCVAPRGLLPINYVVDAVRAATGWDYSLFEALKSGERAAAMARSFNVREGLEAESDWLPERLFESSGEQGQGYEGIDRTRFAECIALYRKMRGWDEHTSVPSRAKLAELDILWVWELLK